MSPRPNATDEEILAITFHLIAQHDVSGVSVDMVATRAGVSKATIYRRWPSRNALMAEAMTGFRLPDADPNTGSLRGDLMALLQSLVSVLNRTESSRVIASFLNVASRDTQLAAKQREISKAQRAPYRRVLERGIERGELAANADTRLLTDMLISPFLYQSIVEHTRARAGDIQAVVDLVLSAYGRCEQPKAKRK